MENDLGTLGTVLCIAWILCVLTVIGMYALPILVRRPSNPPRSDDNQK